MLKYTAAQFIHKTCEDLRFDADKERQESLPGAGYLGTGLKKGQVPYNMQMDTDRLCLERALERFLDSGTAEDAFDVYFCYIEMFIGTYENKICRRMVEKLSEYEANGSSLLMKHRDHYSHSVYVFALGLALYQANESYRKIYADFYGFADEKPAAHHFLQYWGLASLFHDIGYPFELPFEQISSYFESSGENDREKNPFIAFNRIDNYISFDENTRQFLKKLYGKDFSNSNELFARDISARLGQAYGKSYDDIKSILDKKPACPDSCNYFMDHAYFSASVLLHTLCDEEVAKSVRLTTYHIDAMTAIILHNSLYKFSIRGKEPHPFEAELHPLAYMLMLCDELQCWDRTSYGRNSRSELHAMDCKFSFDGKTVEAFYLYDEQEYNSKMSDETLSKSEKEKLPMEIKKQKIEKDVSVVDGSVIRVNVHTALKKADVGKNLYISSSNFIHLYNFAVALNARYNHQGKEKSIPNTQLESEFGELSLEYKLSNINQAKEFAAHLDRIGCFYTDRPVAFDIFPGFSEEDMAVIGPLEHERWLREHIAMGWEYSTEYAELEKKDKALGRALREQTRGHKLMIGLAEGEELTSEKAREHYYSDRLDDYERDLDTKPMNSMLELIKKFDGLRIYKYKDVR